LAGGNAVAACHDDPVPTVFDLQSASSEGNSVTSIVFTVTDQVRGTASVHFATGRRLGPRPASDYTTTSGTRTFDEGYRRQINAVLKGIPP